MKAGIYWGKVHGHGETDKTVPRLTVYISSHEWTRMGSPELMKVRCELIPTGLFVVMKASSTRLPRKEVWKVSSDTSRTKKIQATLRGEEFASVPSVSSGKVTITKDEDESLQFTLYFPNKIESGPGVTERDHLSSDEAALRRIEVKLDLILEALDLSLPEEDLP